MEKIVLLELIYLPVEGKANMISPIQIMKSMFLLKQELKLSEFYEFKPYLYGPCSFEIYSDLLDLENKALIDTIPTLSGWNYYRITKKGKDRAKELEKNLDERIINKILDIKERVLSKSFIELLKYVYETYPEYAKNSVINIGGFKK
jgi:uncharacterized protein YwgA